MKRARSASKKTTKPTTAEYHQQIQNYKQDINTLKNQVSQLHQRIADSDDDSNDSSEIDSVRKNVKKGSTSKGSPTTKGNKTIIDFIDEPINENEGRNSLMKKYKNALNEVKRLKKIISNNDFRYTQKIEENKILKQQIVELKASKSVNPSEFLQIQSDNRILAKKMKLLLADVLKLEQEKKQMKESISQYIERNKALKQQSAKYKKNQEDNQSKITKKSTKTVPNPNPNPNPNQKTMKTETMKTETMKTETKEIDADKLNEQIRLDTFQTNEKYADKIEILTKENQQLKTVVIKSHSLLKENQRLREKIDLLNKDIEHIMKTRVDPTEAVSLASQVQELNDEKKLLLTKLNQTANSLKTLQKTKPRQIDSEAIATLTEKVSSLNQENMDLKSATLTNTLDRIELKKLQKKLQMTNQKARPFDSETIADLTEKIASLAQENMVLRMNSLRQTNSIAEENEKLKKTVLQLEKKSSMLKNDSEAIANLTEKISELSEENNKLKTKNIACKSLKRENGHLKEKLNEVVETVRKTKIGGTKASNEEEKKTVENLNEKINKILEKQQYDDDNQNANDYNSLHSPSPGKWSTMNVSTSSDSLKSELNAAQETIRQMKDDYSKQKTEMKKHFESLLNDVNNDSNDSNNSGKYNQKNGNNDTSTSQIICSLESQLEEQKKRYNSLYDLYQKLQSQFDRNRQNNQALISELESSKGVEVNLINKYLREENDDLKEKLEKLRARFCKEDEESKKKLKIDKMNEFSDLFNNIYKSIGEVTDEPCNPLAKNRSIGGKSSSSSSSLSISGNEDDDFEKLKKLVNLDENSAIDAHINNNNNNSNINFEDDNDEIINNINNENNNQIINNNIVNINKDDHINSDEEDIETRDIIFDQKNSSINESDQESDKNKENILKKMDSKSRSNESDPSKKEEIKNYQRSKNNMIGDNKKSDQDFVSKDNKDNIEELILFGSNKVDKEDKNADEYDNMNIDEEIQNLLQQQSSEFIAEKRRQNRNKSPKKSNDLSFPFESNSGFERLADMSSGNTSDAFAAITRDIDLGSDGDYSHNFQNLLEENDNEEEEIKENNGMVDIKKKKRNEKEYMFLDDSSQDDDNEDEEDEAEEEV